MLYHSDEIFRGARYLYSTPDYDGDPNVYRWNYFYTPVQIGGELVGVRIAVRDMARQQESQIYNWGIKKDISLSDGRQGLRPNTTAASSEMSLEAPLDGGGGGQSRKPSGVSSDMLSGATVSQTEGSVKGEEVRQPEGSSGIQKKTSAVGLPAEQKNKLSLAIFTGAGEQQIGAILKGFGPEAVQAVINEGLQQSPDSDSGARARRLQEKLNAGQEPTGAELARLYQANEQAARTAAAGLDGMAFMPYNKQKGKEIGGSTPGEGSTDDQGAIRETQGVDSGAQAQTGDRSGVPRGVRTDKQGVRRESQISGLALHEVQRLSPVLTAEQRRPVDKLYYSGRTFKQVGMALQKMGQEAARAVIAEGLRTTPGSDSCNRARTLQRKLSTGESITASELGHLYDALRRDQAQETTPEATAYEQMGKDGKTGAATDSVRNTGRRVYFNKLAKWKFEVPGYSAEVSTGLSDAARKVAELGGKDGLEHLELIDLRTGESVFSEIGDESSVGYDFRKVIEAHPEARFAFVHNHNTDGWISEQDLITLLTTDQIDVMMAVRDDGVVYVAPKDEGASIPHHPMQYYKSDMDEISKLNREGKLTEPFRYVRERKIVENMLRDFVKGYFEYDGT